MVSVSQDSLKRYEVRIGDCSLKLKSSHNLDTLNEIVKVVEHYIRSSKADNQALPAQKAFALSCLNMAEELVCLKKALRMKLERLESSTQDVYSELKSSSTEILG